MLTALEYVHKWINYIQRRDLRRFIDRLSYHGNVLQRSSLTRALEGFSHVQNLAHYQKFVFVGKRQLNPCNSTQIFGVQMQLRQFPKSTSWVGPPSNKIRSSITNIFKPSNFSTQLSLWNQHPSQDNQSQRTSDSWRFSSFFKNPDHTVPHNRKLSRTNLPGTPTSRNSAHNLVKLVIRFIRQCSKIQYVWPNLYVDGKADKRCMSGYTCGQTCSTQSCVAITNQKFETVDSKRSLQPILLQLFFYWMHR